MFKGKCQQRDWWARELRETVHALGQLPMELFGMIIEVRA